MAKTDQELQEGDELHAAPERSRRGSKLHSAARRALDYALYPRDRWALGALERVEDPAGGRLASVLKRMDAEEAPTGRRQILERIEQERRRLLERSVEPLSDGTLGDPGPYDAAATVADACKVSKKPRPCRLLYLLAEEFQPTEALELGTNCGISSAYQACALRAGRLTTFEASPYRQRIARTVHQALGIDNVRYVGGLFTDTLRPELDRLRSIDYAFIDGHHQYQPTLDYTAVLLERAAPGALLVFDDIQYSDGMARAWRELRQETRFRIVLDLNTIGVCVVGKVGDQRHVSPAVRGVLRS